MYNADNQKVLVFKTAVITEDDKQAVTGILNNEAHIQQWHIDLDDCDKVLRVVTNTLDAAYIIELVNQRGYLCIELE